MNVTINVNRSGVKRWACLSQDVFRAEVVGETARGLKEEGEWGGGMEGEKEVGENKQKLRLKIRVKTFIWKKNVQ